MENKAIFKLNGGNGALLCNNCNKIIRTGKKPTKEEMLHEHYCDICKPFIEFKTNDPRGYSHSEIKELLLNYPNINMDKFNDALMGITCEANESGLIIDHCDIEKAIRCGVYNRRLNSFEWD